MSPYFSALNKSLVKIIIIITSISVTTIIPTTKQRYNVDVAYVPNWGVLSQYGVGS